MRSHYCGQLNLDHVAQNVTLCGWVNRRRDHGGVIFIDLRDRHGLAQAMTHQLRYLDVVPHRQPQVHQAAGLHLYLGCRILLHDRAGRLAIRPEQQPLTGAPGILTDTQQQGITHN